MAEPIWIAGRVEGDGAVVVDVTLSWDGVEDRPRTRARRKFTVVTDAGDKVEVEAAEDVVLAPQRRARGPWRELERHPTHPHAGKTLHPDGHVELEGGWVLDGERVAIRGDATAHDFVEGSGGPRESPARRVSAITAAAIGVGDDARAEIEAELARRAHARARKHAAGSATAWLKQPRVLAPIFAVLAAALVPLGTYGFAMYAFHLAAVCTWAAVPVRLFPGGAADPSENNGAGVVVTMNLIFAPMSVAMGLLFTGSVSQGDVLSCAVLVFIVGWELIAVLRAMLARPRAEPGYQLALPENAALRVLLVLVLLGLATGGIALMASSGKFSGDGVMT